MVKIVSDAEKIKELSKELKAKEAEIKNLNQQLNCMKKMLFGQKSEKTSVIIENPEQLSFFDEAENHGDRNATVEESEVISSYKRKRKRTRDELLKDLPVEEVVHEVEDKICEKCGAEMKRVGKEFVRDELIFIPAKLFVRKHYAEVVKCTNCGQDESNDTKQNEIEKCTFRKAEISKPLMPHSFCSAELLSHILNEKYCKAVPLYRLEKDFETMGFRISRTTMSNWIISAAERYFKPVYDMMKKELLKENIIHADETVVQVLKEPGRKAKTQSRMWVYCSSKSSGKSNILFEYQPTRSGDHAKTFLGSYSGYLICDGYDGYNKLTDVTRCGCWAHARRKFADAIPTEVKGSMAEEGFLRINKLYDVEKEISEFPIEERQKQRLERSKPILDAFYAWAETLNPSSGTGLSKAINYAINEKKYLYRFLENPNLPIDNNRAENAIRPFTIGRKNWLFCDSVKGAKASAMIYSLASTANANGLKPEEYFANLLSSTEPIMPW